MREIRRKFNAYFNAGNHSMKIEQFATFEMALMVVARIKPDADPAKGYIVFTKYQSMGRRRFTPDFYLVQNASICLRKYRSEKAWKDTLKEYEKVEYDGIRLFEVTSQAIQRKDTGNLVYPDREEDFKDRRRRTGHGASCGPAVRLQLCQRFL